jgi:hypothetical protein
MLPNGLQQRLAAADQSSMPNQVQQELELQRREKDDVPIDRDLVSRYVDAEAFDLKSVEGRVCLSLGAAKDGAQAKGQLSSAVGFSHEIIRAELESEHSIDLVIAARNQNDGLGSCLRMLPNAFEDLGGPHVGELVFDDQAADFLPREEPNRALPVANRFEVGPARAEGLSERRKQGAITSDHASIYRHHRRELADRA